MSIATMSFETSGRTAYLLCTCVCGELSGGQYWSAIGCKCVSPVSTARAR